MASGSGHESSSRPRRWRHVPLGNRTRRRSAGEAVACTRAAPLTMSSARYPSRERHLFGWMRGSRTFFGRGRQWVLPFAAPDFTGGGWGTKPRPAAPASDVYGALTCYYDWMGVPYLRDRDAAFSRQPLTLAPLSHAATNDLRVRIGPRRAHCPRPANNRLR
jgi:hypothetical protein